MNDREVPPVWRRRIRMRITERVRNVALRFAEILVTVNRVAFRKEKSNLHRVCILRVDRKSRVESARVDVVLANVSDNRFQSLGTQFACTCIIEIY